MTHPYTTRIEHTVRNCRSDCPRTSRQHITLTEPATGTALTANLYHIANNPIDINISNPTTHEYITIPLDRDAALELARYIINTVDHIDDYTNANPQDIK